ncbi:MAG: HAD family hydrolase [Thermoleophilaceae bacterium]
MIDAVVFDLDGVLVQSEEVWDGARRELAAEAGVPWPAGATDAMMGMSSPEWSRYVHEEVGVPASPEEINADVLRRVQAEYRRAVPWIPGAREAVRRVGARWPLGLATSSNREIVDLVVEEGGFRDLLGVTVSSEEVGAGKPAPDVYLEAARRLGVDPARAAAVEDSTNGLRSAAAAGMRVIAVPNPAHPPKQRGLDAAQVVLESIDQLDEAAVEPAEWPG